MNANQLELLRALLPEGENLAVVGAAGGDEGKGKIVDLLSPNFAAVARYGGGGNAGHTIYTGSGLKLVSHLIPCGLAKGVPCVIGRGVLVNVGSLIKERDEAERILGTLPPIHVDYACTVWTPYLSLLDTWCEFTRGNDRIGTTGQGIGPMAAIQDLRIDVKIDDLFHFSTLRAKLELQYKTFRPIFEEMRGAQQAEVPEPEVVADDLSAYAKDLERHVGDTRAILLDYQLKGELMFEGSQAAMLDRDWGTSPYTSSSTATILGVANGTGLLPNQVHGSILVTKVIPTRVGVGGPFPSEFGDRKRAQLFPQEHPEFFAPGPAKEKILAHLSYQINTGAATKGDYGQYFQILGCELGATTGRGRSTGALDIPWLRYAKNLNGSKLMALTRFDMLANLKQVPVVVDYLLDDKVVARGQRLKTSELDRMETFEERWECWYGKIDGVTDVSKLPSGARKFLDRLEKALNLHIAIVGTGPGPDDFIVRDRA